jgi:hypothetical protein
MQNALIKSLERSWTRYVRRDICCKLYTGYHDCCSSSITLRFQSVKSLLSSPCQRNVPSSKARDFLLPWAYFRVIQTDRLIDRTTDIRGISLMLETFWEPIRNERTKEGKEGIENKRNIKMQDTRNGQSEVKSARLCIRPLLQFLIRFRSRANCTFPSFTLYNWITTFLIFKLSTVNVLSVNHVTLLLRILVLV